MTKHQELSTEDLVLVRRALALLDAVGHGASADLSAAAVDCLVAAEALAQLALKSPASTAPIAGGDALLAIEEALRLLAELSPAAFASPAVVDAVDALQRAHALASR